MTVESQLDKKPIFLDYQATTPLDPIVLESMLPWLSGAWNAHAIEHRIGRTASEAVEQAREKVAALLGCDSTEITFTSGATEASNITLRGITGPGDKITLSAIEHASVMETACALESDGRIVEQIRVDEDGILDLDMLMYSLETQPTLVSIMAVNNEIGTVQPVEEAAQFCAEYDAPLHSDLTQAVGRISVSLADTPISYASISSHKIYGPQGIGALFVRSGALKPQPLATGGGQENSLRPGTLPVANCVGFGTACELAVAQREHDREHVKTLSQAMLDALLGLAGWQVNGSLEERIPHNLSIAFEDVDADTLLASLPELAVSTGSACSAGAVKRSETLRAIGLSEDLANGTVRIGFGRTTTINDVQKAADLMCRKVRSLRKSAA